MTSADARASSEREHALFVRTTVLEQQLQSATQRAVELDSADEFEHHKRVLDGLTAAGAKLDSPSAGVISIEQAMEGLGAVNRKWAK